MTKKLPWGSITEHRLRSGAIRYRARAGDEKRSGLGLYETQDDAELAIDEARRGHEAMGEVYGLWRRWCTGGAHLDGAS